MTERESTHRSSNKGVRKSAGRLRAGGATSGPEDRLVAAERLSETLVDGHVPIERAELIAGDSDPLVP